MVTAHCPRPKEIGNVMKTNLGNRPPGRGSSAGPTVRRRLSEDVADQITRFLVEEDLQPGDRLPTEPALVDLYDVSRTVVREASRLLVERGLVDIRPGRGMVVTPFDGTSISRQWQVMLVREQGSFRQLMEMRLALEVSMSGFAAERRTDEDLASIRTSLLEFRAAGESNQAALNADLAFHAAVAAAAHNPFFRQVINPINDYLRQTYEPSLGYESARNETMTEHEQIAQAIAAGDVESTRRAAQHHLNRVLFDSERLVAGDSADEVKDG